MQLLLRREQRGSRFRLWAKIELDNEERLLVNRYDFERTRLAGDLQPGTYSASILVGLVVTQLSFVLMFSSYEIRREASWSQILLIASFIGFFGGYLFFDLIRETVTVQDLLRGKNFSCRSVIALARKEAYLEMISMYFRQAVESSKHWDGTDAREIKPLPPDEAKKFILSGPLL